MGWLRLLLEITVQSYTLSTSQESGSVRPNATALLARRMAHTVGWNFPGLWRMRVLSQGKTAVREDLWQFIELQRSLAGVLKNAWKRGRSTSALLGDRAHARAKDRRA